MKVRVLTSLGLALFGIPVLLFSSYIVYPIVVALFALIGVHEMMNTLGIRKDAALALPAYIAALTFPILAYYMSERVSTLVGIFFVSVFALMLYFFGYAVVRKGNVLFSSISSHLVTLIYIIGSFTALSLVRYIPNGVYYFGMVFIASWVCDIFAYFSGRAFGKHKLIPEVSPKKTVEGAIGGVICTTLAFLLYGFIVSRFSGSPVPNYPVLAILGFTLSIVSMFGDLIASLIKREHGIKDYGKLFPGHGGVLDRFDSILAVAPILLAICIYFPPFN